MNVTFDPSDVEALATRVAELLGPLGEQRDEWLDVKGAAEHLKCKPQRVYDLSSAGRIPVHREGGRLLFSRSELDQWVRDGGAGLP